MGRGEALVENGQCRSLSIVLPTLPITLGWRAVCHWSVVTRHPAWDRPVGRDQQGLGPLADGGVELKTSPHRRESLSKTEQSEPFGIGLLWWHACSGRIRSLRP